MNTYTKMVFIILTGLLLCAVICQYAFGATIQIGTMNVPQDVYTSTNKWCHHYGVDTKLALALACQESSWNQNCKGEQGEVGVFQIMLGTVQMYNYGKTTAEALTRYDLDDNCHLGVWYLKRKLDEFKGDKVKAVATFNCGSSMVNYWTEIPVTRKHVTKVLVYYCKLNGDNI